MLKVEVERVRKTKFYNLYFPFDQALLEKVKALSYRKWQGKEKCWETDALCLFDLIMSYKGSKYIFFDFGGDKNKTDFLLAYKKLDDERKYKELLLQQSDLKNEEAKKYKAWLEGDIDNVDLSSLLKEGCKLYNHQKVAVKFIEFTHKTYLALAPGLGKTLCSILGVECNPNLKKIFVITPNSLKFNFFNEVYKFTNSKAYIIGYKNNPYPIEECKYIITHYNYFSRLPFDVEKKINKYVHINDVNAVILDEAHYIKNDKSNTHKNIFKTFVHLENKILLSGTPLLNRMEELYVQFKFLDPIQFDTKNKFLEYYCGMKYDFMYGWVLSGEPKYEELYEKLNCYMYRKRKQDVFDNFPKKTHVLVDLELSDEEMKEYRQIEKGVKDEIRFNEDIYQSHELAIVTLNKLRQFLAKLKPKYMQEIIDDLVDQNEKIVIIDAFVKPLKEIHKMYKDISQLHTGDYDTVQRNEVVKNFQEGDLKIILGSEACTKEGLTLTSSCYMIQLTQSYVPAVVEQLGDRINRIGQTRPCTVYFPVFKNTIDEIVWDVVEGKRKMISKVIDNEEHKANHEISSVRDIMDKFMGRV